MHDALLMTKLFVPPAPSSLVPRPRLMVRLGDQAPRGRLTLVCAPPGYGKTTVVAQWLRGLLDARPDGVGVAWLALDAQDNDPARFLTYLVAAVQTVRPVVGRGVIDALGAATLDDLPSLASQLINDLAREAAAPPVVLTLDDYHVIRSSAVHGLVEFLVERQPPGLRMVLASREDPPLPLPRLRVRGHLTELRADDLRFTLDEALAFFHQVGVHLSADAVAALDRRTEGWIAGLQLAALSLQGQDDVDQFIAAFSGSHRYVIDYLVEEVLQRQPADVRDFLHGTSILDRLSAPLCDRVTGRADGQAMLTRLEHTNLFLVPLDDERRWYRYHHLFADSLAAGLDATRRAELHRRASEWYADHDLAGEAVRHALAAQDFDWAATLIEKAARTTISTSGNLPVLHQWSDLLPQEVLRAHPLLCLYYARSLFFKGQLPAAQRYLDLAGQAIAALSPDDPAVREARGVWLTNSSTFAAMRGEAEAALRLADEAETWLADDDEATRARLAHARGFALDVAGDTAGAETAFAEAVERAERTGNHILGADVVGCLAHTLLAQSRAHEARRLCERAIAAETAEPRPEMGAVYLALGSVLDAQGDTAGAADALERSVTLARQAGWSHVLWQAHARLSLARQALGDTDAAHEAIEQAETVARRYGVPFAQARVAAYRAQLGGRFQTAVTQPDGRAPCPSPALAEPLSERELEILRLIAAGQSNQDIAQALVITVGTAKWHVNHIFGKLGVHSRTQALHRARELGLL